MAPFCLVQMKSGKPVDRHTSPTGMPRLKSVLGGCLALMLAACASAPNSIQKPPEPAQQLISMEEWMARAKQAANEGNTEKSRAAYRAAAQNYPTEKAPWLKLSEDYFNAQDYGNAVIAAQEALQRDMQDTLAHSILAVSGLRLTAGSLGALRQDGNLSVGSRDEAISVARALRDALGANSLLTPVPAPATARGKKPLPTAPLSSAQRSPVPAGPGAVSTGSVMPTVASPSAVPAGGRAATAVPAAHPFDKLK